MIDLDKLAERLRPFVGEPITEEIKAKIFFEMDNYFATLHKEGALNPHDFCLAGFGTEEDDKNSFYLKINPPGEMYPFLEDNKNYEIYNMERFIRPPAGANFKNPDNTNSAIL